MAIKFNVIEKGQPGVAGGGTKKFYANTKLSGEVDIEQLTESIEKMSTVSGADIRAVLYALVDLSTSELSKGNIVRFGELGSIRVSLKSSGLEKEEDVTSKSIIGSKILFTPGKKLRNMQKTLEYQKI